MKKFTVFHPYIDDAGKVFEAYDAEDAAEEFGDYYDSDGDYPIISGSDEVVVVQSPDGERQAFTVSGESVPRYYAQACEMPEWSKSILAPAAASPNISEAT